MLYGTSYYPEQKSPEELEHDIRLLVESGINTVRMGEFSWCRMEPKPGEFHFEWLAQAAEALYKGGIKTIICTPTACPPAWIITENPEILYVDNRGITRPFGGRRHYCYNNETYRQHSARIAKAIAEKFGSKPYVAGFQIDNEPAQEGTGRCHCALCKKKFQNYLADKYVTIEEFNRRSGSVFWSQEYNSFSQIQMPSNTIEVGTTNLIQGYYENPTIRLEYERFCSESQADYQNIQTDILKKYTTYPVTTNATGLATHSINYYKSTKKLDNYAFDLYPSLRNSVVDSFPYAFARGVKEGKHFWVLEFMSGGGHRLSGSGRAQTNPGALKQAVLQQFAHGADMSLHFQFRSYPIGAEQLNYAIVDMDGVPRRRYYEMQETANVLKQLEPLEAAEFHNQVAVCFDYDTHWALRIKPVNDPDFLYDRYAGGLYKNLQTLGINADVISYEADLSKYKLIILPTAFLLTREHQVKFIKYVEQGGTLLATFLTSVKNEDNVGYTDTLPAGLTELFGATVEEIEPVFAGNHTMVKLTKDLILTKDALWSEMLGGKAKPLATYVEDYKAGSMVISENQAGKGKAYYLGTALEEEAMLALFDRICTEAGIAKNPVKSEKEVETVHRVLNGTDYYLMFNFTGGKTKVEFEFNMKDYLTGELLQKQAFIEKNGFLVVSVVI